MLSKSLFLSGCFRHWKLQHISQLKLPNLVNSAKFLSTSSYLNSLSTKDDKFRPVFPSLHSHKNLKDEPDSNRDESKSYSFKAPAVFVSAKSYLSSVYSIPFPYLIYGLSGLIPFALAPVYMKLTGCYEPLAAHAQLVYGATIVSFLGGVSWGNNMDNENLKKTDLKTLGYSIGLPLIGWVSVLVPCPAGFLLLIPTVGYGGYADATNRSYPHWFRSLRVLLSSGVFICLSTTLYFYFTKPDNKAKLDNQQK